MGDKKNINSAFQKVLRYLKRQNVPFTSHQEGVVTIAWKIKEKIFPASITTAGDYLFIYAIVMLREELKDANLKEV